MGGPAAGAAQAWRTALGTARGSRTAGFRVRPELSQVGAGKCTHPSTSCEKSSGRNPQPLVSPPSLPRQRFAEFARHMRRAGSGRKLPEPLRLWAARQRASYREGRLSPERAEALLQLDGWAWTPLAARGPSALRRLRERLHREVSTSEEQEEVYSAGAREPHCYPRCASVGRALIVSVGARREYAAAEMVDAREALRALGYTVTTVQNPSASELRAALIAHATRDGQRPASPSHTVSSTAQRRPLSPRSLSPTRCP